MSDFNGSNSENNGNGKVTQEQVHGLLFGEKLSWQAIIYDLINTERLDPWDVDISLLSERYLQKVKDMEEANFFVSSKVLFAAALLLRIKSEILLNHDLRSLDDILFGKKEEARKKLEQIELDEDVPELVPRSPMPRYKKVTLQELIGALGKAIKTENRRIERTIVEKARERETEVSIPRTRINIRDQIKSVYSKLKDLLNKKEEQKRLAFSELVGSQDIDKRISTFVPLLHLDNQHRVLLEQEEHFDEIYIWLKKMHDKHNAEELAQLRAEVEAELEAANKDLDAEERKRAEQFEEGGEFENPIGDE